MNIFQSSLQSLVKFNDPDAIMNKLTTLTTR